MLSTLLNLPIGIQNSVEILQPEITLLLLVPVALLFPFAAMVISWFSKRVEEETPKLTPEEKAELKARKKKLDRMKKETAKKRKARAKARKAARKRRERGDEKDEWDKALDEAYT
jgi:hypothetical protein